MSNLFDRAIKLLKSPKTEWPVIAGEPATVGSLYVPYVLVLAAIGPIAMLLGWRWNRILQVQQCASCCVLPSGNTRRRWSAWRCLRWSSISWRRNSGLPRTQTQAFKTAVYASTAAWIGAVGGLLGLGLGALLGLAGAVYSIYLLYPRDCHTP